MSDTKHTPGPYTLGRKREVRNGDVWVFSPDTIYAGSDPDEQAVAHLYGIPSNVRLHEIADDPRYAEGLANGRLLRAAPEMLSALQNCIQQIEYLHEKFQATGSGEQALAQARAAVDAATGRA